MTRRAVGAEDKQARRTAILKAARTLFDAGGGELPTAAEIASEANLAKGTVYLYFKTKEEIFACLLLEGWLPILRSAHTIFESTRHNRSEKVQAFIAYAVRHLTKHPELLHLDALSAGVLEKNMTPEALQDYKQSFNEHLLTAGVCTDRGLGLDKGRGVVILMRTYALTRGLWQTTQHDENIDADCSSPAKVTAARFPKELKEALSEYWRGALAG